MRIIGVVVFACSMVMASLLWYVKVEYRQRSAHSIVSGDRGSSSPAMLSMQAPKEVHKKWEQTYKPVRDAERRAREYLRSGDLARAEVECRRALEMSYKVNGEPANLIAVPLMGEICLRQGRNREALRWFLGDARHAVGGGANLNVVIAYCRLGEYQNGKRFYSDGLLYKGWEHKGGMSPLDLPGARNLKEMEASALLQRGLNAYAETRYDEALADYVAAENLVPNNPRISFALAKILMRRNDAAGSLPRLRVAASLGHGELQMEAQRKLEAVEHWLKLHPPQ